MDEFHAFYTSLCAKATSVEEQALQLSESLSNTPDDLIQQLQRIMYESADKFSTNCVDSPTFFNQGAPREFRVYIFKSLSPLLTNVISCAALMRDVAEEPDNTHLLTGAQKRGTEELLRTSFDTLQQLENFAATLQ